MAAITSTPSSRPWVANAGLAGRNAPRAARDQGVGPSVRDEAPRVRKRSFRRGRYVGLRRVQDDALERIARIVPRRPLQGTPGVGIARLPAQANPRRAEIDVLGVVFVVQPGRGVMAKSRPVDSTAADRALTRSAPCMGTNRRQGCSDAH